MTEGAIAIAGNPDSVRQAGSRLQGRTVGADVHEQLRAASEVLGAQSGAAISVERILAMLQVSSAPANLVQLADQFAGNSIDAFGEQIDAIARRAKAAQADLASAQSHSSLATRTLESYQELSATVDPSRERGLKSTVQSANEEVGAAKQRLRALDEERQGADGVVSRALDAQQAQYSASRGALPQPPRVSAQVQVIAQLPNGQSVRVSAVSLAQLKDPEAIRAMWNALSQQQREQLIADSPLLIGNLDGIPLADRNVANSITAKQHRAELEQQIAMFQLLQQRQESLDGLFASKIADLKAEIKSIDAMLGDRNKKYVDEVDASDQPFGMYWVYDEQGKRSLQQGVVLVGFNPMRDSYVTFQGALDPQTGDVPAWMRQVSVVVPGTNSRLAGFTSDLDRGKDLFALSGLTSGYFTWHGAPMPRFDLAEGHLADAAKRGFAATAAPRLAAFVNSLNLAETTDMVPLAHSYGATVLAQAEKLGLRADRVVYVAPAGFGHGVDGVHNFPNTKDVPHFVLQARNDKVVGWNQGNEGLGLGHGKTNPLDAAGVLRLETGYLDAKNPAKGTIESPGGIDTHSTPFTPDSTSMINIAAVVMGDPVTLYHADDVEFRVSSGRVPGGVTSPVADTGVTKPEEWVSSRDLRSVSR